MTSAVCILAAALATAAPIPKDAATPKDEAAVAPTGPAPRMLFLKADAAGKIRVTVTRPIQNVVNPNINIRPGGLPGGAGFVAIGSTLVELKDVRDLKIATVGGKMLDLESASKKLANGAYVLIPVDGTNVAPGWLQMFRDDVIVLRSPELNGGPSSIGGGIIGIVPNGRVPVPQPLPVPVPAPLPNQN